MVGCGSKERAYTLEIRRENGNITALGYAWLERCEFDPSEGITLRFALTLIELSARCRKKLALSGAGNPLTTKREFLRKVRVGRRSRSKE